MEAKGSPPQYRRALRTPGLPTSVRCTAVPCPEAPACPHSQHAQVVEGAVVLLEPRPLVVLEVLDVLHHLDGEDSSVNVKPPQKLNDILQGSPHCKRLVARMPPWRSEREAAGQTAFSAAGDRGVALEVGALSSRCPVAGHHPTVWDEGAGKKRGWPGRKPASVTD